ncbi:uncharacterized protein LOC120350495 [Nilaparvata lugens]|uniref:uncharacterized protein LOC120350495 n=1 Tax=Nilaparvata lugens TaxID=108931 RepID=UPI00193CE8C2|nr:uncharacterized protein LOC120350495 [Nilaparvata lugens]
MTDFETIYILLNEIENDYPGFAIEDYFEEIGISQHDFLNGYGDKIVKDQRINTQNTKKLYWGGNDDHDVDGEKKLRDDVKLIVKFHQNLNRNQDECARVSGYSILVISFLVALDTCFNIFLMLEANNPKMFMNYAAVCICTNIPLLLNYYIGQQISNQNEIFRQCLTEVPWIDKPQWFKQSLLIMMTRANVDTQFKPYGVFVLNLTSYKDLMKAAFSFGNVLYRRKQIVN